MYTGWSSMWTRAGRPASCIQPNIFSLRQQKDITRQPPVRLCSKRKTWCQPWWGLLHDVHLGEDCYMMSTLVRTVTGCTPWWGLLQDVHLGEDCYRMSTLVRIVTWCPSWWGLLQDVYLGEDCYRMYTLVRTVTGCLSWWGLLQDVHLGEDCYMMSTLVRTVTGCPPWWGLLQDVYLGEDCYRMSTLVRIVTGHFLGGFYPHCIELQANTYQKWLGLCHCVLRYTNDRNQELVPPTPSSPLTPHTSNTQTHKRNAYCADRQGCNKDSLEVCRGMDVQESVNRYQQMRSIRCPIQTHLSNSNEIMTRQKNRPGLWLKQKMAEINMRRLKNKVCHLVQQDTSHYVPRSCCSLLLLGYYKHHMPKFVCTRSVC